MFFPPAMIAPAPQEAGLASWYGPRHAGKPTASGALFDPAKMTCAHKRLKFGTRLEVFCPGTGKTVQVVVTDRGPYIEGRILDLSQKAAQDLGIEQRGVAWIVFKILPPSQQSPPNPNRKPLKPATP